MGNHLVELWVRDQLVSHLGQEIRSVGNNADIEPMKATRLNANFETSSSLIDRETSLVPSTGDEPLQTGAPPFRHQFRDRSFPQAIVGVKLNRK